MKGISMLYFIELWRGIEVNTSIPPGIDLSSNFHHVALVVKNKPTNVRDIRDVGSIRKIPWRRAWQTTPVFLPGESHGQRRWANVHGVRKSWIQLRQLSMPAFTSFHSYCDIWLAHTLAKYVVLFFFFELRNPSQNPTVRWKINGLSPSQNF